VCVHFNSLLLPSSLDWHTSKCRAIRFLAHHSGQRTRLHTSITVCCTWSAVPVTDLAFEAVNRLASNYVQFTKSDRTVQGASLIQSILGICNVTSPTHVSDAVPLSFDPCHMPHPSHSVFDHRHNFGDQCPLFGLFLAPRYEPQRAAVRHTQSADVTVTTNNAHKISTLQNFSCVCLILKLLDNM